MRSLRSVVKGPSSPGRSSSCFNILVNLTGSCWMLWWFLLLLLLRINAVVLADCWYDNEVHIEGVEVATAEPCLNCTCSRGALLCYLRICPRLPNPPPPGCILLHRHRTCCPELICTDLPSGNHIEARSDTDNSIEIPVRKSGSLKNACISNGSIYGPGSAMGTSSQCEYCYCLGGEQKCVRPKCLLPMEGCEPTFETHDCCPVHYNCTKSFFTTTTSTTLAPIEYETRGGCIVSGTFYPEGIKILGFGHSICDNCYCIRGIVRCEPLSCAPALFGCLPVIKRGECCAASYNCSGTIETRPLPNYGQFPIVSKEYAKLRKETQYKRTTSKFIPTFKKTGATENTNSPYYVLAESSKSTKQQKEISHTEPSRIINIDTITKSPYNFNTVENESLKSKSAGVGVVEITYRPKYNNSRNVYQFSASDHHEAREKFVEKPPEVEPILSFDLMMDGRNNRGIAKTTEKSVSSVGDYLNETISDKVNETITEITTKVNETITEVTTVSEETTDSPTTTDEDISSTTIITSTIPEDATTDIMSTTEEESSTDIFTEESTTLEDTTTVTTSTTEMDEVTTIIETNNTENVSYPIILKTVINSTECIEKINNTLELQEDLVNSTSTEEESRTDKDVIISTTVEDDNSTNNAVTLAPLSNILADIEMLSNITKAKDDYDYDYAEPTLPPSLPNLRIIPFVAADALESKSINIKKSGQYRDKNSDNLNGFPFANLFSPPSETEGGFVPKEPIILPEYFGTTSSELNPSLSNPDVPAITNAPKTKENNCLLDGRTITHEESITSEGSCSVCVCYFGSIVCQEPQCPPIKPGCRKSAEVPETSSCCPNLICDDQESPTRVLEAATIHPGQDVDTSNSTPDPFRDVIRTEAAPDLHSLFGDMMPFFVHHTTMSSPTVTFTTTTTTTPQTSQTTSTTASTESTSKHDDTDENDFSLDKVWKLLFSTDFEDMSKPPAVKEQATSTTTTVSSRDELLTGDSSDVSLLVGGGGKKDDLMDGNSLLQSREDIFDGVEVKSSVPAAASVSEQRIGLVGGGSLGSVGLLKLAGCNIYGRMYRVGRIITELSGPCLECKCTETGVQCHALKC